MITDFELNGGSKKEERVERSENGTKRRRLYGMMMVTTKIPRRKKVRSPLGERVTKHH